MAGVFETDKKYTIAVAKIGYVGLSIATLLSQYHKAYAVDIIPEKVELINNHMSRFRMNISRNISQRRSWI